MHIESGGSSDKPRDAQGHGAGKEREMDPQK